MPKPNPRAGVIGDLLSAVAQYRRRESGLEEMKAAIWDAASVMSSPADADLRGFLQTFEGRIDMAQFPPTLPKSIAGLLTCWIHLRIDYLRYPGDHVGRAAGDAGLWRYEVVVTSRSRTLQ